MGTHATPFFMVNMGSGMHHGSVRPTTMTKNDDVAQHGGHEANTRSCRLGLQHISLTWVGIRHRY